MQSLITRIWLAAFHCRLQQHPLCSVGCGAAEHLVQSLPGGCVFASAVAASSEANVQLAQLWAQLWAMPSAQLWAQLWATEL